MKLELRSQVFVSMILIMLCSNLHFRAHGGNQPYSISFNESHCWFIVIPLSKNRQIVEVSSLYSYDINSFNHTVNLLLCRQYITSLIYNKHTDCDLLPLRRVQFIKRKINPEY